MLDCVRCGECCKVRTCGFDEYDHVLKQCKSLQVFKQTEHYTLYQCGKYDEIKRTPGNDVCPAFGYGCCRTLFNETRERIIKYQRSK